MDDPSVDPDLQPIFAPPSHKARKTMKVTKGGGPAASVEVSFKDLTVSIPVGRRKERKLLLNNVSGYIPAGEVLYVMGSSGCGKSTLLKTIANVTNKTAEVTGDVLFNSRRLRASDRTQILSFVSQEAPLLGEFTVHETLWFAARLYFGYWETSSADIHEKIDDIIDVLGLDSCRDVVVGNLFFWGLSGGQRKRLSIAIELVSSPAVIALDEPTSGLDSSAALSLVQALRGLAKLGHTVVASIHQPSSKMWSAFSNILLMSQGRSVYFGSAEESVDYFTAIGLKCPEHFNPADYFSAVLTTDFASQLNTKSADELAGIYDGSTIKKLELGIHLEAVEKGRKTIALSKNKRVSAGRYTVPSPSTTSKYDNLTDNEPRKGFFSSFATISMKRAGFASTFVTLMHRFLKSLYRDPGLLLARLVVYVGLGIILGLVYLDLGLTFDTESMLARASVMLGMVGFYSFLSISAVPFILDSRAVLERERKNGAYSVGAYVLANAASLLPATALLAVVASLLMVLMIKLTNFGLFFLGLWTLLFAVECLVQAIACLFTTMETGIAAGVGVFGILFLCSGFFIPVNEMSWAIRWVAYVSPMRYAFRMFMRNECDAIGATNSTQFPSGESLMDFFDLNSGIVTTFGGDLAILAAFAVAYTIAIDCMIRFMR